MSSKVMNCPYCGRILPREFWHEKSQENQPLVRCPRCGDARVWKDSKAYTKSGIVKRYYCRNCGRKFSKR